MFHFLFCFLQPPSILASRNRVSCISKQEKDIGDSLGDLDQVRPRDPKAFSLQCTCLWDTWWNLKSKVTLEEAQEHQLNVTSLFPGPLVTWEMALVNDQLGCENPTWFHFLSLNFSFPLTPAAIMSQMFIRLGLLPQFSQHLACSFFLSDMSNLLLPS